MPPPDAPPFDVADGRALAEARLEVAVLRSKNVVLEAQVQALRERLAVAEVAEETLRAETSLSLRTPLGTIVGYTEILLEEAEERGLSGLIPDLRNIRAACDELLTQLERASVVPGTGKEKPAVLVETLPTVPRSS